MYKFEVENVYEKTNDSVARLYYPCVEEILNMLIFLIEFM